MRIRRSHNLGLEEARKRADRIAEDLREEFSFRSRWVGDALHVEGSGALDMRINAVLDRLGHGKAADRSKQIWQLLTLETWMRQHASMAKAAGMPPWARPLPNNTKPRPWWIT